MQALAGEYDPNAVAVVGVGGDIGLGIVDGNIVRKIIPRPALVDFLNVSIYLVELNRIEEVKRPQVDGGGLLRTAGGTHVVVQLPETGVYDFYYVAKDTAGNYSVVWKKITISTLDVNPPVIKQFFELTSDPNDNTAGMVKSMGSGWIWFWLSEVSYSPVTVK